MFVKTRRAKEDGWSTFMNVSEVHTSRLVFDKFAEHADEQIDPNNTSKDVRWNVRFPPAGEIERIDNNEQLKHGFVAVTIVFLDKQPISLYTNCVTFLCENNGNTAQKLY